MSKKRLIGLIISIAIGLTAWFAPSEIFGMDNLSLVEQRTIALFLFAASMWISEAIPIWATSVLTVVLMLLTISDSCLVFFSHPGATQPLGMLIDYKTIMGTFADPVIMLFLGGFVLAIAAEKCGLDANLARVLLKPFGKKSKFVMLGFILVTAMFSMFMSNTATAAMMLAVLAPILRALPDTDVNGKAALALSIPIAANLGGIGTPIGTPPNAIALKYLNDPAGLNLGIGFGQWSCVMIPYVITMLFLAWLLMSKMFPFKQKEIVIKMDGSFRKDWKAVTVYVTFAITIILWMLDKVTGLNSYIVAMIPFAVFSVTGIVGKDDLTKIPWDVLWLVAGGFALGVGLQDSGLAQHMVKAIPFGQWSPLVAIVSAGLICYGFSTFISNTATAALLMPILAAVGIGMKDTLIPFGGVSSLLVGIALSASLAMALPISTPPNALAHATGFVKQKDMMKIGFAIGLIGLVLGYLMMFSIGKFIFN